MNNKQLYYNLVQRWIIPWKHIEEHKVFSCTDLNYINKMNNKLSHNIAIY